MCNCENTTVKYAYSLLNECHNFFSWQFAEISLEDSKKTQNTTVQKEEVLTYKKIRPRKKIRNLVAEEVKSPNLKFTYKNDKKFFPPINHVYVN